MPEAISWQFSGGSNSSISVPSHTSLLDHQMSLQLATASHTALLWL